MEVELEVEMRRSHSLEVELETERRRSHSLEAELEAERRRSQTLGAELEAERRRSHSLEVELETEKRQSLRLGEELDAGRGRGQAKGAGPDGEKPLEEVRQCPHAVPVLSLFCPRFDPVSPGGRHVPTVSPCPPQAPLLLRAQLGALSHILTLQERELNREVRIGGGFGVPQGNRETPGGTQGALLGGGAVGGAE